jgi:predicted Ser/Thr protein kinase
MSAPENATCPRCGGPRSAAGDCPRCLLELGIAQGTGSGEAPPTGSSAGTPTGTSNPGPAPEPPSIEEVRAAFPDLEIEALLGRGGMGAVFRARQRRLDRLVALKVLPRALGRQAGFAERFAREARALARLSHPGIVTVHDHGQADGLSYLVMEYVDGVNLRELLRQGPLEPAKALAIARELCEALQYAHDEGVVHRDIKPENVLVDSRGRVKVADFGLAKLTGGAGDVLLTRSDQVMGTPHYMAPEQLERPAEVDHRADLFALGVVLYEMLTGGLPRGHFEPPSQRVRVDVKLDEIVLKALEREPARRYQHALEIKTDVDGIPAEAARAEASTPTSEKPVEDSSHVLVGWKAFLQFLVSWILIGLAWNMSPAVFLLACGLGIAATGWVLRERIRSVPGWLAQFEEESSGQWVLRRAGFLGCSVLAMMAIVLGNVSHWEKGVRTWRPHALGAQGVTDYWRQNPWNLLRLTTDEAELSERFPPGTEPRVVTVQSHTSVPPGPLGVRSSWLMILGGFVLLGLGAVLGTHRRGASPEERRRTWHVGGEVASWSLCALMTLYLAGPLGALVRHEVQQGVGTSLRVDGDLERTTAELQRLLDRIGLQPDVRDVLSIQETRSGVELGRAVVLRARFGSPWVEWSTSLSGPRRNTPLVWATLVARSDGSTHVELHLGTYDPRLPEHDQAVATVNDLARRLERNVPGPDRAGR